MEQPNLQEPTDFQQAVRSADRECWGKAMDEEIKSLHKNNTWCLVDRPKGQKVISCKWVYKLKENGGQHQKQIFKARLVARGYTQRKGIDYHEVFSPVVKHTSIRCMLGLAAVKGLEVEQMDVKTAFLHGDLKEVVYMEQPEGYESDHVHKVCLLNRPIYGLKQSSREWYLKFDKCLSDFGFKRCQVDNCVYMRKADSKDDIVYLLLYVDDILLLGKRKFELNELKRMLAAKFEMKDLGAARRILGIDIIRNKEEGTISLSQETYLKKLLNMYGMAEVRPVYKCLPDHLKLSKDGAPKSERDVQYMERIPYASMVGSLMYAMVCTRPDFAYPLGVLSRFMSNPGKTHWEGLKWLLKYVKGTIERCITYGKNQNSDSKVLQGYCDSDFAKCNDTRKSIGGYMFCFYGSIISWKSQLQHVVALSTTEAEFVAATEATKEGLWLKQFLKEVMEHNEAITLFCDSQSALHIIKNPVFNHKSKHIDVKMHFIRNLVEQGELIMHKVDSIQNPADCMTKVLSVDHSSQLYFSVDFG